MITEFCKVMRESTKCYRNFATKFYMMPLISLWTRRNEEVEKEIFEELSKHPPMIPWLKKAEKVTVTGA